MLNQHSINQVTKPHETIHELRNITNKIKDAISEPGSIFGSYHLCSSWVLSPNLVIETQLM